MKRLALLASLIAVSGCVAASGASNSTLSGSDWQMLAIDGDAAANLDQAELTFTADTLGASVGCNQIGGNYHVNDNRLIAGPLNQTEIYCEGPVGGQERHRRRDVFGKSCTAERRGSDCACLEITARDSG